MTTKNEILDELMQCPSEELVELDYDCEYENAHNRNPSAKQSNDPNNNDSDPLSTIQQE